MMLNKPINKREQYEMISISILVHNNYLLRAL